PRAVARGERIRLAVRERLGPAGRAVFGRLCEYGLWRAQWLRHPPDRKGTRGFPPPRPAPPAGGPDSPRTGPGSPRRPAAGEQVGLSQVGFAPYDPKYTFAEAASSDQGSVIVCLLEQDWALTQTIPSAKSEREVVRTYEALTKRAAALASFLHERGFRAEVQS